MKSHCKTAGNITDNPKLKAKGKAENIVGKVQEKIGQFVLLMGFQGAFVTGFRAVLPES